MKSDAIKILLIDDDEDDYVLTRDLLSSMKIDRYALDWASTYEEGLEVARQGEHHVCLVDYRIGDRNGIQLIREAREARLSTPMILLTGQGDHDVDVEAMKAGATDYLIKHETPPARLERTIRYAVQLNTERCHAEAELAADARRQAVVASLGRLALTGGNLNDLLVEAVSLVARTLEVEYCKVWELLPSGAELGLRSAAGWEEENRVGQVTVIAAKESQAGYILRSKEPVVIEDLRTDARFSSQPLLPEHGIVSDMSVAIRGRKRPYGVLAVHTTSLRKFVSDEVSFLNAIADVLGQAIARAQSEDAVRQSESQFRALFESALDAVLIADDRGVYVDANPAACALLGVCYKEVVGCTMADFTEKAYRAETADAWDEFLKQGRMCGAFRLQRPDGKLLDIEFTATANFLPGRHFSMLRDVTERQKLEEQLRQSQRLESVGMLAGGIAHDFNNLLTVITGYSELLARHLDTANPLAGSVGEIRKAAERATSLTSQLLAFSRKQVLQPTVLDLNAVIRDLQKMLARLVGDDMELCPLPGTRLGQVKADRGQVEQIIVNLVVNARDAMPNGGKITIETANIYLDEAFALEHIDVQPGWYVMLEVSDTGHGMDAETQKYIFEPFYTTKELGQGTGLGLATVYGIVKQSHGNIWVYSEVGLGTSFKIYLPLIEEPVAELKSDATPATVTGAETILIVEDQEMVRKLARKVLQLQGYKVLEAASGEDAILICNDYEGPIHLLLTDMVMPQMDGRELARQLVALRPNTLVLYMSGYTDRAIVHHGNSGGPVDFIGKPFTPDALALKVAAVLHQRVSPSQLLERIDSPTEVEGQEALTLIN